ncbi:M14 family zinc carboxypeptidase [Thalassoglobus polymorphus]|uniref:Murein peptide amidase A n=1 Tax=Thalassoglobus polymorphus TaxID=2527994 RepID=A0A517QVH2_9PLAN|nr:M14 family zinc carboxypeptidase [Thalassoglobus polymorphus]QDT35633.1 murein peptide amidase A [Thalassoglobus polymorphus]
MSRFPFGCLLSTLVLSSSCASFKAPSAQTPGLAQQEFSLPEQSLQEPEFSQSNAKQSVTEKQPATEKQSPLAAETESAQLLPRGFKTLDIHHSPARPSRIELGSPQPFPGTAEATESLSTNKPVTKPVVEPSVQEALPQASTSTSVQEVWKTPMKSGTGRPIQMSHAGHGSYRILILGSIYGNEPESIELLDSVAGLSGVYANSPKYSFVFLRTPNPDGLAEHIHTNHHGVDLNRNMPSTWFTATPNRLTGPHPASEIETQNLIKILKGFQPHRVIHVRSSIGQRPLVLLNEKLKHAVDPIRKRKDWSAGTFDGEYKIGSVEEFVTLRTNAELMAVHLPPKGFQQMSAKELLELSVLSFDSPQVNPQEHTPQNSSPHNNSPGESGSENNIANRSQQEVLPLENTQTRRPAPQKPDGELGYVEILPPPPNRKQAQNPSGFQVTDDPKYYELPPPPER